MPPHLKPLKASKTDNILVLHVCGLITVVLYIFIAQASPAYAAMPLSVFLAFSIVAVILWLLAWWKLAASPHLSFTTILLWAILMRLVALSAFPILEDDIFRYLWDGYQLVEFGSPYSQPPASYFGDENLPQVMQQVLNLVSYPDITTIYGPVSQGIFGLAYLIAPGKVWPLQLFAIGFDISILLLLRQWTTPRNLLLYAWCPLIIHCFAFNAHSDVYAVFFMLAGCYYRQQGKLTAVAILLALAVATKLFALLLLPFLLGKAWKSWLVFSSSVFLIYLPFLFDGHWDSDGLLSMAGQWQFNSSVFYLLSQMLPAPLPRLISLTVFAIFYAAIGWAHYKRSDNTLLPRGDLIFGSLLLLMPVVNPWYLIWLLVFSAVYPRVWTWTASVVFFLSYISGINLNTPELSLYQQPLWVPLLEYGTILTLWCYCALKPAGSTLKS